MSAPQWSYAPGSRDDREEPGAAHEPKNYPPRVQGRVRGAPEPVGGLGKTPAGAGTTQKPLTTPDERRSYPRRRGDDANGRPTGEAGWELPPQARGRPPRRAWRGVRRGATPAGAGTTSSSEHWRCSGASYPRRRGDDARPVWSAASAGELPPQARGRPGWSFWSLSSTGATPAGAGTTPEWRRTATIRSSYPRRRGDDCEPFAPCCGGKELPPQARGRHRRGHHRSPGDRATPAGAGTTVSDRCDTRGYRSYPRRRGDDTS